MGEPISAFTSSGMSGMSDPSHAATEAPIILYDGVCGLCNRLNRLVLARDPSGRFRFAALQSALAGEILARHGRDPGDLDTLWVVLAHGRPGERLLAKSDAVLWILHELGGAWRAAGALRIVPRGMRDRGYDLVARTRYRLFGRSDACPLPDPVHRARFLVDPVDGGAVR
jgi:predicted DCC family thiol-disulfide oxidoreductase YuxK